MNRRSMNRRNFLRILAGTIASPSLPVSEVLKHVASGAVAHQPEWEWVTQRITIRDWKGTPYEFLYSYAQGRAECMLHSVREIVEGSLWNEVTDH